METLGDLLDFVFVAIDLPLELEKTRQKYIQARKCLNNCLQTGFVQDDKIKEAQNKIDKILYIEDDIKDNPDSYWDMSMELYELIDIVSDLNGCTTIR